MKIKWWIAVGVVLFLCAPMQAQAKKELMLSKEQDFDAGPALDRGRFRHDCSELYYVDLGENIEGHAAGFPQLFLSRHVHPHAGRPSRNHGDAVWKFLFRPGTRLPGTAPRRTIRKSGCCIWKSSPAVSGSPSEPKNARAATRRFTFRRPISAGTSVPFSGVRGGQANFPPTDRLQKTEPGHADPDPRLPFHPHPHRRLPEGGVLAFGESLRGVRVRPLRLRAGLLRPLQFLAHPGPALGKLRGRQAQCA